LVILAGIWVALPWLFVAGASTAAKSIVWEHSLLKSKLLKSPKFRMFALAARILYPKAFTTVAVSEPVRRDLAVLVPRARVTVIPNSAGEYLNENAERPQQLKDHIPRLITVGSLTQIKRQHLIIQALTHLNEEVLLEIVGTGPELDRLREVAKEHGVKDRVFFRGFLSPAEVQKRMHEADVLVHSSSAETFGLVYIEASAAQLPVVSTRTDVAQFMIPTYVPGQLCEPTPRGLATAIKDALSAGVQTETWERARRKRESEFGAEAVLAAWVDLLAGGQSPVSSSNGDHSPL